MDYCNYKQMFEFDYELLPMEVIVHLQPLSKPKLSPEFKKCYNGTIICDDKFASINLNNNV